MATPLPTRGISAWGQVPGQTTGANINPAQLYQNIYPNLSADMLTAQGNNASLMSGNIPNDTARQVWDRRAAASARGGVAGSPFSGATTAQDLGLTRLQLQNQGQTNMNNMLGTIYNTGVAPDIALNQANAQLAAAPDPQAAAAEQQRIFAQNQAQAFANQMAAAQAGLAGRGGGSSGGGSPSSSGSRQPSNQTPFSSGGGGNAPGSTYISGGYVDPFASQRDTMANNAAFNAGTPDFSSNTWNTGFGANTGSSNTSSWGAPTNLYSNTFDTGMTGQNNTPGGYDFYSNSYTNPADSTFSIPDAYGSLGNTLGYLNDYSTPASDTSGGYIDNSGTYSDPYGFYGG